MASFAQSLGLTVDLIPKGRPNRPGTKLSPSKITIHNTDNASAGANAKAHAKFVKTTGYYLLNGKKHYVSWHYTVDDGAVYQHLPINEVGWHAGSGNSKSIGIEICMNKGIHQDAANLRAATLVASLLKDLKLSSKDVVPHMSWTGKKCPTKLLDNGQLGAKWKAFIELVEKMTMSFESPTSLVASNRELKAVATATLDASSAHGAESAFMEPVDDHEHGRILIGRGGVKRKRAKAAQPRPRAAKVLPSKKSAKKSAKKAASRK